MGRTVWGVGQFGAQVPGGTGFRIAATSSSKTVNPTTKAQDVSFLELENAGANRRTSATSTPRAAHPHVRTVPRRRAPPPVAALQDQLLRTADATPLDAILLLDNSKLPEGAKESLPAKQLQDKWVQAIGRVEFYATPTGVWKVAIIVTPKKDDPFAGPAS